MNRFIFFDTYHGRRRVSTAVETGESGSRFVLTKTKLSVTTV